MIEYIAVLKSACNIEKDNPTELKAKYQELLSKLIADGKRNVIVGVLLLKKMRVINDRLHEYGFSEGFGFFDL